MTAREFAAALAREIGGAVRPLDDTNYVVATVDGRVPVLIRDHRDSLVAHIPDGLYHGSPCAEFDAARLATFRAAAFEWLTKHPRTLSMYAIALGLIDAFGKELGERWYAHIPAGHPVHEMSVRCDAGDQIAIFPEGVGYGNPKPVKNRAQLDKLVPRLVRDIKRSRAMTTHHDKLYEQQNAAAATLIEQLAKGTGLPTERTRPAYSDAAGVIVEIECGERPVALILTEGRSRVRAGIAGRGEFECALSEVEARMAEIREALDAARATLTVEDLEVGARYRVLEQVGELTVGDEVIYKGFDDIENHYGEHLFDRADGKRVIVGGAYHWSLVPAHRYLEPI